MPSEGMAWIGRRERDDLQPVGFGFIIFIGYAQNAWSRRNEMTATKEVQECIEACQACAETCRVCADECEAMGGMDQCTKLCRECAAICDQHRGRLLTGEPSDAATCVDACNACAAECEKGAHHMEVCGRCAAACRKCAETCQRAEAAKA